MKHLFNLILFSWILGHFYIAQAQPIQLSGKVIDVTTHEPVPFANVAIKAIYKGTACNDLGEFLLKVDSLPTTLIITHLSYEPIEIEVNEQKPLVIELTPGKYMMRELVIKGRGTDEYAYNLVERAHAQIQRSRNHDQYGRAFYRQISKNGDEYSELYEMFFDTRFSNNGIEDWAIQEGRYALKLSTADSFIYNKNFTLMLRLLTIVQPPTDDLVVPVSEQVRTQYYLTTEKVLAVNNREVAQIQFVPKEDLTKPAMEGEIWIDTKSYQVLKLKGNIVNDNLHFISLKGKVGSWKNYRVSCEIAFKPQDDQLLLDYIRLKQNFDYYVKDVFANKVETTAFFSYYEYYTPPKRKKLGGRLLRFNKRDADVLDKMGYNQQFWDDNIIVKRTPVETAVIHDFEEERAFGSIYLNNKNQFILEDYELDKDPFIVEVKDLLHRHDTPRRAEKLYIHHDKPWYISGDEMMFKAYAVNMATNLPSDISQQALYFSICSPANQLVCDHKFVLTRGSFAGSIHIPQDLPSGKYWLYAQTEKMRKTTGTFFRQQLIILNAATDEYTLSVPQTQPYNIMHFNPEGGQLNDGLPSQVGFVAMDKFGQPMAIRGRLLNKSGRTLSNLKTEMNGYGSFFMLPGVEEKYNVMVQSAEVEQDSFPKVQPTGYTMIANNLKPNTIDINIRGGARLEGKKFYLLVISQGVLYDRRMGMLTRGLYRTEIPKNNLPAGVCQLLLVDEFGDVKVKRLVYVQQPEGVFTKYYLAKKEYKSHDRIDMVIELDNQNGKAVKNASFSMAVLDADLISRDAQQSNIQSYFQLEHLADHPINQPANLFVDYDREALKKLDWILLNQHTVWPMLNHIDTTGVPIEYPTQIKKTAVITGIARRAKDNSPLNHGYIYYADSINIQYLRIAKTNQNGIFHLPNIDFYSYRHGILLAMENNGEPIKASYAFTPDTATTTHIISTKEISSMQKRYLSNAMVPNAPLNKNIPQADKPHAVYGDIDFQKADYETDPSKEHHGFKSIFSLLSSDETGATLTDEQAGKAHLKGSKNQLVVILDGLMLAASEPNDLHISWNFQLLSIDKRPIQAVLKQISPSSIRHLAIYKNTGDQLTADESVRIDAIVLVSKNQKGSHHKLKQKYGTATVLHGFDKIQENSKSRSGNSNSTGADNRATLYWNPQVTTNRRGRAKIGFYNSDVAKNFQICIEGITADGLPFFDIYFFGRNKANKKNR